MEKNILRYVLKLKATVVSFKEIMLAFSGTSAFLLRRRLNYYVQTNELYPIRRGLYAKDKHYDRRELATKIFTPAYVSFETILVEAGVIFQYYSTIFVATYQSKDIVCDGQAYSFRKIKDTILTDTTGVENRGAYFAASPERAYLDLLYLNKDYYVDNFASLNVDKILAILPIYNNKRMKKVVDVQVKTLKEE